MTKIDKRALSYQHGNPPQTDAGILPYLVQELKKLEVCLASLTRRISALEDNDGSSS